MNLYQVPPPEEAEPFSALQATRRRLTLWLAALSSVACMLVWWYDGSNGLNSPWAAVAVPIIAAGIALGGLLIWRKPNWHNQAAALCNASVSTYFIGSLISTTEAGGQDGLYEVASNAQFMPLLYLTAFVTMTRGAARLSWLTYAATVLSYLWLYGFDGAQGGDPVGHFWFMLLITHPIFILALSYVSVLQTRLKSAEVEVHTSRERFLAMLSHEIRTPLTVLAGFIETLQSLPLNEAERARYLGLMSQQALRMQTLVNDLLTLSRLEGSPQPGSADWTPLATLMAQCEQEGRSLSATLSPGNPHVIEVGATPALELAGAPSELLSALSNLLSNAIRYTPPGGRIEAGWHERPGGKVEFVVRDTGPGIAAEHIPRLTERFYRVDAGRSRDMGGTGLGLAIVKHIVTRHRGRLGIASRLGEGASFTVTLPASKS